MIEIFKEEDYFRVVVTDEGIETEYFVNLDEETLIKYGNGRDAEDFIRDCFNFLLERESSEEILHKFDIKDIKKYFPEWEKII